VDVKTPIIDLGTWYMYRTQQTLVLIPIDQLSLLVWSC